MPRSLFEPYVRVKGAAKAAALTVQRWVRSVTWFVLFISGFAFPVLAEPMQYIYPPPESGSDARLNYYWDLLEAALRVTKVKYGPYTVATSPKQMNPARAERSLMNSKEITMLARATSKEREEVLLPIRIPLDKGLIGYRLFLIQRTTQDRLDTVRTVNDLKNFSIGQGIQWIDTDIMRAAGLNIQSGGSYESLFLMLAAGRFDIFSRGINEIGVEFETHSAAIPDLRIEKNLLLYYPLPRYFFFARTPDGELLAKRVEEGLRTLIKNGEFERRYQVFKREMLAGLNISGRRLLTINNPLLSVETPLADRDLWDTLERELKVPTKP